MERNEKIAETLNDLVEINNDRIVGYERAAKETKEDDADLRSLFNEMADESRNYLSELKQCVRSSGEEPAKDTTKRGKIYRVWMDMKAAITGHNRKAILDSCEYGEDAAQRAYERALEDDDLTGEARAIVAEQKTKLRSSHDRIKRLRDSDPNS
jgi:uncharacterized protein (TIGR02284 family)